MDPTSLLEQLRDVHSPDAIGAWPPAIGWILLVLLTSTALIIIFWFSFRWYRANAWRRKALKAYKVLQKNYQQTPSTHVLTEISSLLKRCAASINQDTSMLALTGSTWKSLLQIPKSPLNNKEVDLLCFGHYQAKCDQLDSAALLRIRKWIKTLQPFENKHHLNTTTNRESNNTPMQENDFEKQTEIARPNLDDKYENQTS